MYCELFYACKLMCCAVLFLKETASVPEQLLYVLGLFLFVCLFQMVQYNAGNMFFKCHYLKQYDI